MTKEIKNQNSKSKNKKYDLEERTMVFAKQCIALCKSAEKNYTNIELSKQLLRSSTSVGANYREANDTITKKDFKYRIGICKREAKESNYWLLLLAYANPTISILSKKLADEALQLARIFASIALNVL